MIRRLAVSACLLAACSSSAPSARSTSAEGTLAQAFRVSAENNRVPRDLLVAIALVEDGLAMPAHRSGLHPDAAVPAAGPLMLRHGKLDTLAIGASLVGRPELELREDSDLALEAGARVLATLPHGGDLPSWEHAIEEMSGYADAPHRTSYAHHVFATLARGGSFVGRDGEAIDLPSYDLPPSLVLEIDTGLHPLGQAQYAAAEWIPTSCANKCNATRSGATVQFVVIHDTEGGWNASVSTLQNDPGKSVQYLVGTDGRVAQFVTEETTAWHAGNLWYNQRSIGIEHVGYRTQPYAEAEYAASAALVDHLTKKYGIPRDRSHVIGHDQIPDGGKMAQSAAPCALSPKACVSSGQYGGSANHDDPGVWEWAGYMARFGGEAKCNDVTAVLDCSSDKTQAFRCVGGKVEVRKCASPCVVQKSGTDDLCEIAPAGVPVSTTPSGDPPPPKETTATVIEANDPTSEAPAADADAGCSIHPIHPIHARGGRGGAEVILASIAIVLAGRMRRRKR